MTLLEFLEARLAEDEAAACAATPGPWEPREGAVYAPDHRPKGYSGGSAVSRGSFTEGVLDHPVNAVHMARWDPARVLAEVELKRALIRFHAPNEVDGPTMRINGKDQVVPDTNCTSCSDRNPPTWPCATIKLLALPYADHRDYQPEWGARP